MLFWAVCAWAADSTGYVIDYGAYPDQKLAYYTLRDVKRTLGSMAKGAREKQRGVKVTAAALFKGAALRVARQSTD